MERKNYERVGQNGKFIENHMDRICLEIERIGFFSQI